ncbi:hypothetical protein CBA19CS22_39040 [Caballeronia novacaledonica]|uniref:Uncharacterized protein n=1 Tax=Caballeronia novacaledonica TaxID=1544861 RepID=A0ACB5R6P6_9BURK|nr:hypothetical protein [Caballeronia sp. LZ029]MDR5746996.1 hypothetical protein [Caballeronia sp. LZ029]GJH22672.1 hypothetical protein CBA19CS22_39040 [Caballeronia novacaledonica]
MNRFSTTTCYSQRDDDVLSFLEGHLKSAQRVLYIGTVGIDTSSLYFATHLAKFANIDFRFIVERRRDSSRTLNEVGARHRSYLEAHIPSGQLEFTDVNIVADDGATIGGRGAARVANQWYSTGYTDIVIDASGMSRGICFPLVKQAIERSAGPNANVHVLMAMSHQPVIKLHSEANDRAEWMHGFQGTMGLDVSADTLKLWIPQLAENSRPQMNTMFQQLSASSPIAEVCPIVPFPSLRPRRGDDLLFEFEALFLGDWESSHLNVIYAHESDPMDVFHSIARMEASRKEVFRAADQLATTILSPNGWRMGSLGMLLAAIELDLPMLYVETIGYTTESTPPDGLNVNLPDHLWHVWLAGVPYETPKDHA